jgi:hypothetical protein
MKRDLLLVHPPQRGLLNGFASGLIDLANFVAARAPEIGVRVIDLALTPRADLVREARSAMRDTGPAPIVGITTTTASYRASLDTARAFKAVAPEAIVVLGGHHASPQHDVILRRHAAIIDVVVRGEGENALLDLARGRRPADVPGCSTHNLGVLHVNPPGPLLSRDELDSLPVTFNGSSFRSAPGKFDHATYVSARGCPLRCAFCAVAGETIRAKSIRRVVADLRQLVTACGYSSIAIEDNFFAQNRARVLELCAAIAHLQSELDEPFAWDCQTRVESMHSRDVQRAFAEAGCEAVYLGIESFLEEELEYLGKTPRPQRYVEMTFEVCAQLLEQTYDCYMNLQVALPGEDHRRQAARIERLTRLGRLAATRGRTITVFPQLAVIYPGTQHFWKAFEHGAFGPHGSEVFESFSEWEAHEEPIRRFLGENFAHGVGGIPLGLLDHERLRRRGEYVLADDSVGRLRDHLRALDQIEGVRVFKYGTHLAQMTAEHVSTYGREALQ